LVGYTYRRTDIDEYRIILIGKRNGDEVYEKLKRLN
jgi:hypothetical protein